MLGKGRLRMLVALCWLFLVVTWSGAGEHALSFLALLMLLFSCASRCAFSLSPSCSGYVTDRADSCGDMKVMDPVMSYICICICCFVSRHYM